MFLFYIYYVLQKNSRCNIFKFDEWYNYNRGCIYTVYLSVILILIIDMR